MRMICFHETIAECSNTSWREVFERTGLRVFVSSSSPSFGPLPRWSNIITALQFFKTILYQIFRSSIVIAHPSNMSASFSISVYIIFYLNPAHILSFCINFWLHMYLSQHLNMQLLLTISSIYYHLSSRYIHCIPLFLATYVGLPLLLSSPDFYFQPICTSCIIRATNIFTFSYVDIFLSNMVTSTLLSDAAYVRTIPVTSSSHSVNQR